MERILLLATICLCLLVVHEAKAQPDRNEYQSRLDKCENDRHELTQKLFALREEKDQALLELKQGYFCSQCKNSKTQIENGGEEFNAHLGRVKGERVAATQQQIAENQNRFNDKIRNLENQVDGKRLDCERIVASYDKAYKESRQRAEQDVQRENERVAADAEAKKKQQAEEQRQRAEEERQRKQAEYEAYLAEQRRKQALKAANDAQFVERVNDINAERESKLDEHRKNSTLDDVTTYSDAEAKKVIRTTDSEGLGKKAFNNGSGYLNSSSTKDYIQEKTRSLLEETKKVYKEQVYSSLFDQAPKENDIIEGPFTSLKKEIASDAIHKVIDAFAKKGEGALNKFARMYQKGVEEYRSYEPVSLTDLHGEMRTNLINNIDIENGDNYLRDSGEYMKVFPKRIVGLFRHYAPGGSGGTSKGLFGELMSNFW